MPATEPDTSPTAANFAWPARVYFEDTDAGNVVYHAGYLRFYERCRTEWLRALGWSQRELLGGPGIAFAVRSMAVDWIAPARLDDELVIDLVVREVRGASLKIDQRIMRKLDGVVLSTAAVRVACVRLPDFRPAPIPESILESLAA